MASFNFSCMLKNINELISNYYAIVILCDFVTMLLGLVFAAKATHYRNTKYELKPISNIITAIYGYK